MRVVHALQRSTVNDGLSPVAGHTQKQKKKQKRSQVLITQHIWTPYTACASARTATGRSSFRHTLSPEPKRHLQREACGR